MNKWATNTASKRRTPVSLPCRLGPLETPWACYRSRTPLRSRWRTGRPYRHPRLGWPHFQGPGSCTQSWVLEGETKRDRSPLSASGHGQQVTADNGMCMFFLWWHIAPILRVTVHCTSVVHGQVLSCRLALQSWPVCVRESATLQNISTSPDHSVNLLQARQMPRIPSSAGSARFLHWVRCSTV